jgi:hypothetical protein
VLLRAVALWPHPGRRTTTQHNTTQHNTTHHNTPPHTTTHLTTHRNTPQHTTTQHHTTLDAPTHTELGHLSAAKAAFDEVIRATSKTKGFVRLPETYANLGHIALARRQHADALRMYEHASKLHNHMDLKVRGRVCSRACWFARLRTSGRGEHWLV